MRALSPSSSISSRYTCSLSKDDLALAILELNEPEDDNERLMRIDNLRNAFTRNNKDLALVNYDDSFILRFLRVKKFNHSEALNVLTNYHTKLPAWPELYKKFRNPQLIKHVFDAGSYFVLRCKAKDGSAVSIGRPGILPDASFVDFLAAVLYSYDQLLVDERVQIRGLTVIDDMSHFGFHMLKQFFNVDLIKRISGVLQDCIPIRLKSINFVFESKLCDIMFSVFVLPLANKKLRKKFKLLGKNVKTLHKLVDPSFLPAAYGGIGKANEGDAALIWRDIVFDD